MSVSCVYQVVLSAGVVWPCQVVDFAFLGPGVKRGCKRGNHVISPQVDVDSLRIGTISHFVCVFAPGNRHISIGSWAVNRLTRF